MNTPRIYTYRISFEEVPYYYYGVHKEKKFNEEYYGSPVTNRWCWDFYTPKKQILEIFEYSNDGWLEAQKVEGRLIREFYNKDKWCLNANCNGKISLEERSKAGKKGGKIASEKCKNLEIGIFGLSKEKRSETGKKSAQKAKENKTGLFSLTTEELSENGRKGGEIMKKNKAGIFGLSAEDKRRNSIKGGSIGGLKGGKTNKEKKLGICGLSKEERKKYCSMAGKSTTSQKWICLETGYVTTPCALSLYQKARGIDTSKRKRLE